ncbi:MAG: hypothetical protein ACOCQI_06725, partial [Desulfosalsimonas sp.]
VLMGVNKSTVSKWKRSGKLKGLIRKRDGMINLTKASEILPARIAPIQQASINARWGKEDPRQNENGPTEQEMKRATRAAGLDENMTIFEAQRQKAVYEAALKKNAYRKEEGAFIKAADVERAAYEAGKTIKEQLLAVADRIAPLVAAEPDSFECRQIVMREVNYVLENLSQVLGVPAEKPQVGKKKPQKKGVKSNGQRKHQR